MIWFRSRALLLFLSNCLALTAQEPALQHSSVVSGTVREKGTSTPIAGARVSLQKVSNGLQVAAADTDERGHYVLNDVPAGKYNIKASHSDFQDRYYGQTTAMAPPSAITVMPGPFRRQGADVELPRPPVIEGRVLDEESSPVDGGEVRLLEMGPKGDPTSEQTEIRHAKTATTGADGRYRLAGFRSGNYLLLAVPPQKAANKAAGDARYIPTFFGDVVELRQAVWLDIRDGQFLQADIRLRRSLVFDVTGHLRNVPDGAEATVRLIIPDVHLGAGMTHIPGAVAKGGSFRIRDVPSGHYLIHATAEASTIQTWSALTPINIRTEPVSDVVVPLSPPVLVKIRASLTGHTFILALIARTAGLPTLYGRTKADGQGALQNVAPGEYHVSVTDVPPGYYLRRIVVDGVESPEGSLSLVPGITTATVVVDLTKGAGSVTGVVTDSNQPAPGAMVALTPVGARGKNPGFCHTAVSDEEGRFLLTNVAPGEYRISARLAGDGAPLHSTRLGGTSAREGTRVSLDENAALTITLPLVR